MTLEDTNVVLLSYEYEGFLVSECTWGYLNNDMLLRFYEYTQPSTILCGICCIFTCMVRSGVAEHVIYVSNLLMGYLPYIIPQPFR